MIGLLLAGCVENLLFEVDKGPAASDTGRDEPITETSTGDSAEPGDSAPPPSTCSEAVPPDGVVATDATCMGGATTPSWDLSIRERWTLDEFACGIGTSRGEDVDGDGAITTADGMQVWVGQRTSVLGYETDGRLLRQFANGAWDATTTLGDVDPSSSGAEVVIGWFERSDPSWLTVGDENGQVYQASLPTEALFPWLADLDGDGAPEAVLGGRVYDASDGTPLYDLDGITPDDASAAVSADLDGDGLQEIVAGHAFAGDVSIFEYDGTLRATCYSTPVDETQEGDAAFAIGNLDADPEGEVVAVGNGFVALCDSDGSLIRVADFDTVEAYTVAIAELDGDAEPEIVVSDDYRGVIALDVDLTEKWRYKEGFGYEYHPLSVADLDNDGQHEVLVHAGDSLRVFAGNGAELASVVLPEAGASWSFSAWTQPIVVDLDADGKAEILVAGADIVTVTNADGGWTLPEADQPWSAKDRFPGDRTPDGGIPPADAWWLDPGRNVWQGLPAGGVSTADLGVDITDVCVDDCAGDAVVTIEVANAGLADVDADITVELRSIDTDELLASTTLPPTLAAGVTRSVVLDVPATRLAEGLRAVVSAPVEECGVLDDTDDWRDTLCP